MYELRPLHGVLVVLAILADDADDVARGQITNVPEDGGADIPIVDVPGHDDVAALADLAQRLIPGDDPGTARVLHHSVDDVAELDRGIDADTVDLQLDRRHTLDRLRLRRGDARSRSRMTGPGRRAPVLGTSDSASVVATSSSASVSCAAAATRGKRSPSSSASTTRSPMTRANPVIRVSPFIVRDRPPVCSVGLPYTVHRYCSDGQSLECRNPTYDTSSLLCKGFDGQSAVRVPSPTS